MERGHLAQAEPSVAQVAGQSGLGRVCRVALGPDHVAAVAAEQLVAAVGLRLAHWPARP